MILLFDAGNSRLKWALYGQRGIQPGEPQPRKGAVHHLLKRAWAEVPEPPKRVFGVNVAGDAFAERLAEWTREAWGIDPEFLVAERAAFGVTNAYLQPAQLGSDRWAALIAAHNLVKGPLLVVDAGTATTLDALDVQGRHLGGLILPGIELMQESLLRRVLGIEPPTLGREPPAVGPLARDTHTGIAGGGLYASIALIDRLCADLEADLGQPLTLLLTGGAAGCLHPLIGRPTRLEPHLVLRGVALATQRPQAGVSATDAGRLRGTGTAADEAPAPHEAADLQPQSPSGFS